MEAYKMPPFFLKMKSKNKGKSFGNISITTEIKKKLLEIPKGQKDTYLEILITKILEKAIEGNERIIRDIWNYIDGTSRQKIKHLEKIEKVEVTDEEVRKYNQWRKRQEGRRTT